MKCAFVGLASPVILGMLFVLSSQLVDTTHLKLGPKGKTLLFNIFPFLQASSLHWGSLLFDKYEEEQTLS